MRRSRRKTCARCMRLRTWMVKTMLEYASLARGSAVEIDAVMHLG